MTRYRVVDLEDEYKFAIKFRCMFILDYDSYSCVGCVLFGHAPFDSHHKWLSCGQPPLMSQEGLAETWHIELKFLIANDAEKLCSNPDEFILGRTLENQFDIFNLHKFPSLVPWTAISQVFSISVGGDPLRWIDWFRIGVFTSFQKGTWIQGPIAFHLWKPGFLLFLVADFV